MLAKALLKWNRCVAIIKRGWNEVPDLYFSIGLGLAGATALIVRSLYRPPGGYITRYKERYLIMRPDDERLVGYPKQYVTDSHLLK